MKLPEDIKQAAEDQENNIPEEPITSIKEGDMLICGQCGWWNIITYIMVYGRCCNCNK